MEVAFVVLSAQRKGSAGATGRVAMVLMWMMPFILASEQADTSSERVYVDELRKGDVAGEGRQ
jgi:hypothetical protein